ncbi:MAG: hypothetical protein GY767_10950 [Shimia sp.]|nr:hypothetical protein [Shimia sp.]MCP4824500.1 hypothetical protein [Shimia sp.]
MLKPIFLTGLAFLLVTGCSSAFPSGLIAAARLDPLETAASDIAIAIGVPEILRLADGDAQLFFGFTPNGTNTAPPVGTTVPLTISTGTGSLVPAADQVIYVFGFDPASAAQLSAVQDQIKALQEQSVMGTGTLSAGITGGCLTGPLNDSLPVATWIQTSSDGAFVPLTRPADFLETLPHQERLELIEKLKPC